MPKLSHRIRRKTAAIHTTVEKKLFADYEDIKQSEYVRFLLSHYRFQRMLEEAVARADFTEKTEWKLVNRKKVGKIESDLRKLSFSLEGKIFKENPFSNWTEAELLGGAYVAEGATLGGRFILASILKSNVFDLNGSRSFLTGYGSATGMAWKGFQNLLEREGRGREDEVIHGAQEAFKIFSKQIEEV